VRARAVGILLACFQVAFQFAGAAQTQNWGERLDWDGGSAVTKQLLLFDPVVLPQIMLCAEDGAGNGHGASLGGVRDGRGFDSWLLARAVKERSYRLTGLLNASCSRRCESLLKDAWGHGRTATRYLTFIILARRFGFGLPCTQVP